MMTFFSSRPSAIPGSRPLPAVSPARNEALARQLSTLYARAQDSLHVFGSPLGPFQAGDVSYHVPRFVYFGPHTSDDSLRLAFYTGFDAADLRGTLSLLRFVERLAESPELGQGLNLSFFPLVDALGAFTDLQGRGLSEASWSDRGAPELDLLDRDVRLRGYHGFVRLESAAPGVEEVVVQVRGAACLGVVPTGVELICSEEFEPLPCRFEGEGLSTARVGGPLSLADDLPFAPFEITLALPLSWTEAAHRAAVHTILQRFIRRYRGLHAYCQHL